MIRGKRVMLRAIEEKDLDHLLEWLHDPVVAHLVGGFSFPTSRAQQLEWYRKSLVDRDTQRWIVQDLHDGRPIGVTGLWSIDRQNRHALSALKLGSPESRGKGYGTDAILTVTAYAFYQVGLHRLWSEIVVYNAASYRAYVEKCGWRVEGVLRQSLFRDGVFYDQVRIGILRSDFEALPQAREYIPQPETARVDVDPARITLDAPRPGRSDG